MDATDRPILDADRWFVGLPADRRDRLLAAGITRHMTDGARVYGLGDPPNGLWAVLEGEVRLKGYPAPGIEFLALTLRPGNWFGEMSTIDGGPRPHDAVVLHRARLLHVPCAEFDRAALEKPLLYHDLGRLACMHERIALEFVAHSIAGPLRARLARLLLTLAHEGDDMLKVRQDELATMLGVSRQSLNRHLGALSECGAIGRTYGTVRIVDRGLLQSLATNSRE